nr:hypothetical protein [Treponema sp.]
CWSYMGEMFQLDFADKSQAQSVIDLLEAIKAENFCSSTRLPDISGAADISATANSSNSTSPSASIFELNVVLDQLKKKTFTALRGKGLCILL